MNTRFSESVSMPTGIEVKPEGVIMPSGPGVTKPIGSAAVEWKKRERQGMNEYLIQ